MTFSKSMKSFANTFTFSHLSCDGVQMSMNTTHDIKVMAAGDGNWMALRVLLANAVLNYGLLVECLTHYTGKFRFANAPYLSIGSRFMSVYSYCIV